MAKKECFIYFSLEVYSLFCINFNKNKYVYIDIKVSFDLNNKFLQYHSVFS